VTVNGEVISLLGTKVDPEQDVVTVDGKPIQMSTPRTLMLNKPAGYITTRSDPHARDTVMSLVPEIPGLHPIGRLDKDTTGLLLLTNDGTLTNALTHPRHRVNKTYHAWVQEIPTERAVRKLMTGVEIEGKKTAPAQVEVLRVDKHRTLLAITIHEGRKRQVRLMCAAVGHPVISLTRVSLGPLVLGHLKEGKWRDLSPAEVQSLFRAAGVKEREDK